MIERLDAQSMTITEDDPDRPWREFMAGIMAHTVELCLWLCRKADGRPVRAYPRSIHRRLINAAIAWRWVFEPQECELPLSEVCLFLGLSECRVRRRILAACSPRRDINQLVVQIISECGGSDAKPKRKAPRPSRVVSADWSRLRDFRRDHPFGTSIEDFRRLEVGRREDKHQA